MHWAINTILQNINIILKTINERHQKQHIFSFVEMFCLIYILGGNSSAKENEIKNIYLGNNKQKI